MSFKVDGTTIEFTGSFSLTATFAQAGNVFSGIFTGYQGLSNMVLQVYDNKSISPTTYTAYGLVGTSFVGALLSYNNPNGTFYSQSSTNSDATITISEITEKTVRGTFSATLKAAGKADIAITEGKFYVWRAN
jgi:hypothetical protein